MRRTSILVLLVAVLTAADASGQENPIIFQLSLSNPGARSLGFGGAFVALADDATAAFVNPAGLVQLVEPEVSIEGRAWSFTTAYTAGGRVAGEPSGIGLDTAPGLVTAESSDDTSGLSFVSVVYPKGRWSVAFYRHSMAKFAFSTETQGLFGGSASRPTRADDLRSADDLEIVSYGVSGAWRLNDSLSLGFGLTYFDGGTTSATVFSRPEPGDLGVNPFLPEQIVTRENIAGSIDDWGLNAGVLWAFAKRWTLGGFLRQGPGIEFDSEFVAGPAIEPPLAPGDRFSLSFATRFPDAFGLGTSFRAAGGHLTASFEWTRVEYSDILSGLTLFDALRVDDADELHLGAEYVFFESKPVVALRLGAWLDPDHRIRYVGEDPVSRALAPPGDDELHLAAGLGLAFSSFQLDLAFDLSDAVDTASLSAIYNF